MTIFDKTSVGGNRRGRVWRAGRLARRVWSIGRGGKEGEREVEGRAVSLVNHTPGDAEEEHERIREM
ncbi:hypothetical protein E2C01_064723 [Portunus trituberculatus]|uniref:Uncharacterized protein n=1 Tax=Portunus trituberculatus TaxID=210409 RepID=A0A5B7HPK2_PORTR|nr:hypothetical protein [Portunus trituberculatus]